jgi:hypothetical protein
LLGVKVSAQQQEVMIDLGVLCQLLPGLKAQLRLLPCWGRGC